MLRRPEQHDRVALLDELLELLLLLDDPGARPVDDLEAAGLGAGHDLGLHPVGPDDDRRAVIDVVEGIDGPDAEGLEIVDDALVVDDLAEGVGRLAVRARFLGHVDGLADAVAEAGALRDADRLDGSHADPVSHGVGFSRPRRAPRRRRTRPADGAAGAPRSGS